MSLQIQTRSLFRPLVEFVYPPLCPGCDALLERGERTICDACRASMRAISPDDDLYLEMHERLCREGNIAGVIAAFHFEKEGVLQKLVHQLKYEDMTGIGEELGRCVGAALTSFLGNLAPVSIVPVPLHRVKKRERGYNQSEYIAKGIQRCIGFPIMTSLLRRKKYTKTQTQLTLDERRQNVRDAFEIPRRSLRSVSGRKFLLVDDVITTGATIQECARVLKARGAGEVYAISVALAGHAAAGTV